MRFSCFRPARRAVAAFAFPFFLLAAPAERTWAVPPTHSTAPPGKSMAAPVAGRKSFGGIEYLDTTEISRRLGLEATWIQRGRSVRLQAKTISAEIFGGSREARINDLRVFLGNPVILGPDQLYVSRIDFERCLIPRLRPGLLVAPAPLPKLIAIDPGHGGADSGTVNPRVGLLEKDVALDVAKRLKTLLEQKGFRVVLTRSTDRMTLPKASPEELAKRAQVVVDSGASLLVSIHFNELPATDKTTRGAEVYTYPPATQHATGWWDLAEKGDAHLQTIDQPGNRFDPWNAVLAQSLQRQMLKGMQTPDRGQKLMHLGILRWLNCPAVLVEPAILSQDDEARRLLSPEYRQQIAQSLVEGIGDYCAVLKKCKDEPDTR